MSVRKENDGLTDAPEIRRAAEAIRAADALIVTAGAGFGVDSGLPDFRGPDGFWRAYPPFAALGLHFQDLANESLFYDAPHLAWGFYGHRLALYRDTKPHAGFGILSNWIQTCPRGGWVFTSNVDGHFQAAGLDAEHIVECHGSIHHLQALGEPHGEIWSADDIAVDVDLATMHARPPLPQRAGRVVRPNILMFGDRGWNPQRTAAQRTRYEAWQRDLKGSRVVLELGAGTAVPTVRYESERCARAPGAQLIRINAREAGAPPGSICVQAGALPALRAIAHVLEQL